MLKINLKPVVTLLNFSLIWRARVMKDMLMRYKILVLFLLLILAPTLSSLSYIITLPTKSLVSPHPTFFAISLFSYQALGIIWFMIHQILFSKQAWDSYLRSLPLSKTQKLIYDFLIFLTVDFILWIPLLLAAILEIKQVHAHHYEIVIILIKSIINVCLVILLQVAFKSRSVLLLLLVLLSDSVMLWLEGNTTALKLILICSLFCLGLATLWNLSRDKINNRQPKLSHTKNSKFTFESIQIKNLSTKNQSTFLVPAVAFFVTAFVSICLMKYQNHTQTLQIVISAFMFANALILSNFFVALAEERQVYSLFLKSLPLSPISIIKSDMLMIGGALTSANMILVLAEFIFMKDNFNFSFVTIQLSSALLFLGLTYFPQLKFKTYGFFISLSMLVVFMWFYQLLFRTVFY